MGNVNIINHPLVKHKITLMRDENTGTREFRILVEEVAMLMGYEAMRDLPTEDVEVKTPITTRKLPVLCGKKLAIVPILRAGLGMVSGLLALVPSAKVGHIGLYRDEVTHEPHEYYCKLPDRINERLVIVCDPMLATGGSAIQAVDFLKDKGCKNIKFMCIIAAPEGLRALQDAHPDVKIYCASLDDHLDEHKYIIPGLGDAAGYEEDLYQTPEGLYFLHVGGGETSIYPAEDIVRMAKTKVKDWMEKH